MAWEPSNGRDIRLVSCFGSPVSVSFVMKYRQPGSVVVFGL